MPEAYKKPKYDEHIDPELLLLQKENEIMETVSVIESTMKETQEIFARIEKNIGELKKNLTNRKRPSLEEAGFAKAPSV